MCIGCGLGRSEDSEKILIHTLKEADIPCIADADGLNILSGHMEVLRQRQAPVIVTPHMKEMSRLTGESVAEIAENRIQAAGKFAEEYGAVCVLKDSRTVVAQDGHHTFLNLAGNNAMAKAGSGDVLAGVITGLAAQGMTAFDSAALGVFLHACGGDEARGEKGAYSVLAQDLIAGIEKVLLKQDRGEE